jgi:hypothetical protein
LRHAIISGDTFSVRKFLRKQKKWKKSNPTAFPMIEPYLWMSLFKGNPSIFKLLLQRSTVTSVLASRHPQSGATLLHGSCYEGNHQIVKELFFKIKGGSKHWINVRDRSQGYTPLDALIQGYQHQWRNFHNAPHRAMLQGGRKEHIGTRASYKKTLALLLAHAATVNADLIERLIEVQWSDGLQLALHATDSPTVTWQHVVTSIQEIFTLVVRLSKFLTKHGNVAVDDNTIQQYDPYHNESRFNAFAFLGLDGLKTVVTDPSTEYNYDRARLYRMVFDHHNKNSLTPLLDHLLDHATPSPPSCAVDVDNNDTPLHAAAYLGNNIGLQTLFDKCQHCVSSWMKIKNRKERTPLMAALASHSATTMALIQTQGGSAGVPDKHHWIDPFHLFQKHSAATTSTIDIEVHASMDQLDPATTRLHKEEDAPHCNTIEWTSEAQGRKVFQSYYRSNVPVVIQSHTIQSTWLGFQHWTQVEYFQSNFPKKQFNVFGIGKKTKTLKKTTRMKTMQMNMHEFAARMNNTVLPPLWLVETDTGHMDASFVSHVGAMTGRFGFYEDVLKRASGRSIEYSNYQFMIAPKHTGASPHFHNSAVNVLFSGQKMWYMFPPSSNFYSTMPVHQWFERFDKMDSEHKPQYVQCIQNPGDVVYVPDHWGHAVLSIGEKPAIGFAHLYNG